MVTPLGTPFLRTTHIRARRNAHNMKSEEFFLLVSAGRRDSKFCVFVGGYVPRLNNINLLQKDIPTSLWRLQ